MSKSAKSLFYFSIYVLVTGFALLAIPDLFVTTLQLPDIESGWARVIGLLAIVIGCYDMLIARNDITPLIQASVYMRFFFAFGIALLIVAGQMPVAALPLGLIDALAALWTMVALNNEKKTAKA